MKYILATGSTVIEYPYSIEKLRSDNPETSFPFVMDESELSEWGVYQVTEELPPTVNEANEQLEKTAPTLLNGAWFAGWTVTQASTEEIERRKLIQAALIREQRNHLMEFTDHTQLADWPGGTIKQAKYAVLRQKYRDVPQTAGFPWSINWPILEGS